MERKRFLLISLLLWFLWNLPLVCCGIVQINDETEKPFNGTCEPCPIGTFSNNFSRITNCTDYCVDGYCPRNLTCASCKPGSASNVTNATFCQACQPGYIAAYSGEITCSPCDVGQTNNSFSTACNPCPAGSHATNPGSECSLCPRGYYSGEGSASCSVCPPGTYNPARGSAICHTCGAGRWNPEPCSTSATACLDCPIGYYCPSAATSTPQTCPANFFCTAGSSEPVACQLLFESNEAAASCHAKITVWVLVTVGGVVFVVLIVGFIWLRNRAAAAPPTLRQKETLKAKKFSSENDRLIPPSTDGPVYAGL